MLNLSFARIMQSIVGLGLGRYVNVTLLAIAVFGCIWSYTNSYVMTKEAEALRKDNAKLLVVVATNAQVIDKLKANFELQTKIMTEVYQAGLEAKIQTDKASKVIEEIEKTVRAANGVVDKTEEVLNKWQSDMDECMEEASGGPPHKEGNQVC